MIIPRYITDPLARELLEESWRLALEFYGVRDRDRLVARYSAGIDSERAQRIALLVRAAYALDRAVKIRDLARGKAEILRGWWLEADRCYRWMVRRAAEQHLGGYRELGQRLAITEMALTVERAKNARLEAELELARGLDGAA